MIRAGLHLWSLWKGGTMFKPFSTEEIRVLSCVKRYKVERKVPLFLILTIVITVSLFIGYLFGLYQAESIAKNTCEIIGGIE
jgi:hypothetical protein